MLLGLGDLIRCVVDEVVEPDQGGDEADDDGAVRMRLAGGGVDGQEAERANRERCDDANNNGLRRRGPASVRSSARVCRISGARRPRTGARAAFFARLPQVCFCCSR